MEELGLITPVADGKTIILVDHAGGPTRIPVTITGLQEPTPLSFPRDIIPILTKAGLNAITKALAIEYAPDGIRFNAVAPGIVDTPMHKPEAHAFLKGLHPIARLGTTDEIVEAVTYLDRAGFVSGEVLHVDGGAHAGRW